MLGELQRRVTRKSGQIYDPVESPNALVFVEKEMSSLDFSLEEPTSTPERDLYDRTGLNNLIDPTSDAYFSGESAADVGRNSAGIGARIRCFAPTYLRRRLDHGCAAAAMGEVWSPSLARDRAELKRIEGGKSQR